MMQFYSVYPIFAEVPQKLSWTHWVKSKYQLYLPNREELKALIKKQLFEDEQQMHYIIRRFRDVKI